MATDVTLPTAALAGILSFLSPCVLPLVPPYLTFIAGTTMEEISARGEGTAKRDVALAAVLFVLGFSTIFVALGATASVFGQVVRAHLDILSILAGLAIVAMGLHFLGLFRLAFLYREARLEVAKPVGLWGAYVMGLAFAVGWTPCIGPILAAILAIAGSQHTAARGAGLLAVYSAGLGVPFLVAALMIEPFFRFIRRFSRHFGAVEKVVGVLLVLTGIGFMSGGIELASSWLIQAFPNWTDWGQHLT
ncbi:MAG TPA: cytochrome c biogenesis protein CcdA [Beijerinckiaceae bacterium]|nr:cytochrome c biogenesis protein CcdA [Beijerinckiaceae bacterium]